MYLDPVGQAVTKACGERNMAVGILSRFTMQDEEAERIEKLAADFPGTRAAAQPATPPDHSA